MTCTVGLSACADRDAPEVASEAEVPVEGVERIEPDAGTEEPTATLSGDVLQTQLGPDGSEVDLRRAVVTGDILTVEIVYRNPTDGIVTQIYSAEQVSIIDDATSERYDVLQDESGRYMASPMYSDTQLNPSAGSHESAVAWFKFPAPPPSSQTISVNIPEVGAFTGVPVQR